jgi:hypothetical protein
MLVQWALREAFPFARKKTLPSPQTPVPFSHHLLTPAAAHHSPPPLRPFPVAPKRCDANHVRNAVTELAGLCRADEYIVIDTATGLSSGT